MTITETCKSNASIIERKSVVLLNRFDNILSDYYDLLQILEREVHSIVPNESELKPGKISPETPKRELFIDLLSQRLEKLEELNHCFNQYLCHLETF